MPMRSRARSSTPFAASQRREAEHAVERRQTRRARGGRRARAGPRCRSSCGSSRRRLLEALAELPEVVELAVVRDVRRAIGRGHRLRAALDVEDGQAPVAEGDVPVPAPARPSPFAVGPRLAMRASIERQGVGAGRSLDEPCDAAHVSVRRPASRRPPPASPRRSPRGPPPSTRPCRATRSYVRMMSSATIPVARSCTPTRAAMAERRRAGCGGPTRRRAPSPTGRPRRWPRDDHQEEAEAAENVDGLRLVAAQEDDRRRDRARPSSSGVGRTWTSRRGAGGG